MENKICVYAICKNESKFVKKWLESMSEADYIVVLDTGSTDGTYKMLKDDSRVTSVLRKKITPWRFDVARNESIKMVPDDANILVCTDFDEVFSKGWADILRNSWTENTNRAHYLYSWSMNDAGEGTDTFIYDKIHDRNYHWYYPVHEVLAYNEGVYDENVIDICESVHLYHHPDNSKNRSFYFDLLKLSVEENPDNPHVKMLLAREYLINKDYDMSLKTYLEVLKMPLVNHEDYRLVLLESLLKVSYIYKIVKNYDEALWYCLEFIKEDYTYREPYLFMAEMYNDMKMYSLAESMVNAALKYSTRKYNWVEEAKPWTSLPSDILGVSYYHMKDYKKAIECFNEAVKHDINDTRLLKNLILCYENLLINQEV